MAAMSNYLKQALLSHIFRDTAYPQPATIALALCTVAVVETDTGNLTGKEVVGGSYARVNVGRGDLLWNGGDVVFNTDVIVWPIATTDWSGPIIYLAIIDDSTIGNGNLLFFGALSVPKTVSTGDILTFDPSELAIAMD